MIREAVALQPGEGCFEFRERHLGASLAAADPLQDRIVAVVEPVPDMRDLEARLVLDRLRRDGLADAGAQAPLGNGRRLCDIRPGPRANRAAAAARPSPGLMVA